MSRSSTGLSRHERRDPAVRGGKTALTVYTYNQAAAITGLARRTLERLIAVGEGPAIIELSPRRRGILKKRSHQLVAQAPPHRAGQRRARRVKDSREEEGPLRVMRRPHQHERSANSVPADRLRGRCRRRVSLVRRGVRPGDIDLSSSGLRRCTAPLKRGRRRLVGWRFHDKS